MLFRSVRLRSEPTDNVTIYVESSNKDEGVVDRSSLAFDKDNWESFKQVKVTGQPDNKSDGDRTYSIRLLADNKSEDKRYLYLDPPDVVLRNLDTAAGGFYVSEVSGATEVYTHALHVAVRI